MTHQAKQKPWNVREVVINVPNRIRQNHQQQIATTAKAIPKQWEQVDLTICRKHDQNPDGLPPNTDPLSFVQATVNGGKHFLQLRMGSLRVKGHKGGHMTHKKFARLPQTTQQFWESPNCPCNTGTDSPEHRILSCPINGEARLKIASVITKISGKPTSSEELELL